LLARLTYDVAAPILRTKNRLTRLLGARVVGAQAMVCRVEAGRSQILLLRLTYRQGWFFPGGGVKSRETPIDAVRRELREEAGIEAHERPSLVGVYLHEYLGLDDIVVLYRLDRFSMAPMRSWEIAEQRWFDLADLPDGLQPACARRIGEVFHGQPVADHW
jgi:8-oxo-dGTP pyrophosphatase MutT (NUDIX family)